MTEPLVELQEVYARYGDHTVLHGIDFALGEGERVGITGPIGSGKTSFLHVIVGLLKPAAGSLRAFGRLRVAEGDFHEVRKQVGLVFQDPDDQLFCPTVLEDVSFGPLNLGCTMAEAREVAHDALQRVGLEGFETRVTYRLSGGEKRLAALATVLAMKPDVLLLDEPQNGLDRVAYERVRDLLIALPQSMIIVSHDQEFLDAVTTHTLRLEGGRIKAHRETAPPTADR